MERQVIRTTRTQLQEILDTLEGEEHIALERYDSVLMASRGATEGIAEHVGFFGLRDKEKQASGALSAGDRIRGFLDNWPFLAVSIDDLRQCPAAVPCSEETLEAVIRQHPRFLFWGKGCNLATLSAP